MYKTLWNVVKIERRPCTVDVWMKMGIHVNSKNGRMDEWTDRQCYLLIR